MIEGPRTVKFATTSLVLKALKTVKTVPRSFISHAIMSLRKKGMTPFAKIFTQMAKKNENRNILIECQYPERVVSLLLEKTNQNFNILEIEKVDSYFGT